MTALEVGQTLDRYILEALVGEGGMGQVYRAFDTRLRRHVALKVRCFSGADPHDAVAEVLREARAAMAITHPNVAAVLDAGEVAGRAFIAVEYVRGSSLRRFIGATEVAMETRLRWLADIAGALAAAHRVGVGHGDIRSENVMVREDGLVKVLLDGTASDGRADQVGWAVLAYELLTGRSPWKGTGDLARSEGSALSSPIEPLHRLDPRIPLPVEAAILRALAGSPEDCFPTMDAVVAALLAELPPPSSPRAASPPPTSRRVPTPRSTPALWNRSIGPDLGPVVDPAARTTFASRIPPPSASWAADAPTLELRPPSFDAPVDLDEHIRRIPSGATIKGIFFLELQRVAEEASVSPAVMPALGLAKKRYFAFRDYSLVDYLRLTVAVVSHVYPRLSPGEGLRRLGHSAPDVVMKSQIGRAVFGLLLRDLEPILLRGPRAYKLLLGVGDVSVEKISDRTYRFHARNLPAFLETYQVGVIEGVLHHCGAQGRVLVALQDVANAIMEVEIL